ncbi:SH2 domain-containing protein 5 isoform X2 [Xenopus tropicalis]|nr:SH2 domain-containing protein 5 isoform X2 [Xenopus tropicalis]
MCFLKDCPRRRPVILRFCLLGVKMYDAEGEALLMAHALRRIHYTTFRPDDSQFAFVSRNPHCPQLFCHLFVGGQPSEAQVLNLLLCRAFQLQYLARHPEHRGPTLSAPRKSPGVGREPLDPEVVSPSVNALISFRRVPLSVGEEPGAPISADLPPSVSRSASLGTASCYPTLVRKKAIRSKVLRSGAYRSPGSHMQLTAELETCREQEDPPKWILPELSEKMERLQDGVWFCEGMNWEAAMYLLQRDRLGAYFLHTDPVSLGRWTLFTKTQCGVIPYSVCQGQEGSYHLEHLQEEFGSLAALVGHHSGSDSSLLYPLAPGRINPCYEPQEPSAEQSSQVSHGYPQGPCAQNCPPTPQETPQTEVGT